MEYTVQKLARLAGVSARTLRYYDEIGLLKPARTSSNGYRIYGAREVDLLQQILFYRALGFELDAIAAALRAKDFDRLSVLRGHLAALRTQREQLDALIETVSRTITHAEGGTAMPDKDKFEGFKRDLIETNEKKHGAEARKKYGDDAVEQSNAKLMRMTETQFREMEDLAARMQQSLERAVRDGLSPDSEEGLEIASMHRAWLGYSWNFYSPEAHAGLAQLYVDDARFTAHYDGNVPGCAQFLRDAVAAYVKTL